MTDRPMLSVVLPCRNQADHIGPILRRYAEALESSGASFELVVVPNASTDGTQAAVEEIARNEPRLRVVVNPLGGWGRSVRAGLDAAQGAILCYTNTARTEPSLIPTFVDAYRQRPNTMVKATRVQRHAPMREIGSLLYNLEGRLLFGLRCGDINGTPKVFGADFYRTLSLRSDGDLLDLEIMSRAHAKRLEIHEIPVPGFKRHGGKSSTTWRSAWNMYAGAVQLWFKASA